MSVNKDPAWREFSRFVRTRDCFKTTGGSLRGHCVTCWESVSFQKGHAGHFLAGRGNAILFDERGTNLQCPHCNIDLSGNYPKYLEFMLEAHGQDVVDELTRLKNTTVKIRAWELIEIAKTYKQKTAELFNDRTNLPDLS